MNGRARERRSWQVWARLVVFGGVQDSDRLTSSSGQLGVIKDVSRMMSIRSSDGSERSDIAERAVRWFLIDVQKIMEEDWKSSGVSSAKITPRNRVIVRDLRKGKKRKEKNVVVMDFVDQSRPVGCMKRCAALLPV